MLAGIAVSDSVGFEDIEHEDFSISDFACLSFTEDTLDQRIDLVIWDDNLEFGARNIGGLIGYAPVHFLPRMLKTHPFDFIKGEKLHS